MIPFSTFKSGFLAVSLVSSLALSSGMAFAQDNRIQLRSLDGGMSLEGTFIGFRDGVYVLEHDSLGTLRIESTDQIICEGPACPGNEIEEILEEVVAEVSPRVQLTSGDGRLSIEGDFVELTPTAFVIDSPSLGRLTIDIIPGLECIGEACPELAPPNAEKLISGSSREIAFLLPALLEGYAAARDASLDVGAANDDAQVPVTVVGSGGAMIAEFLIDTRNAENALAQLADQTASLVLSDRRIADSDIAAVGVPDLRGTPQEQKIALDGLVFATHPSNPVGAISAEDLSALFSGDITNWQSLGGGDQSVAAGAALETSRDAALLEEIILAPNSGTSAAASFANTDDLVALLAADPGAIGVLPRSSVAGHDLNLVDIRQTCGLLSRPTEFEIKSGGYALTTEIYSYFAPRFASPELADFARWIGSPEAETLIAEHNMVTSVPGRMALQDMGLSLIHTAAVEPDFVGEQFAEVVRELRNAERSTATFRFEPGSSVLDQDSLNAVSDLAEQIRAGAFSGFEVLLVGFSDSSGEPEANTELALERAQQVQSVLADALSTGDTTPVTLLSAGELMPIDCNTTAAGRERNRRVETWIRLIQG